MIECVLTIDLGSSACKVIIFNRLGEALASVSINYPTWRPDVERAEQQPKDWWETTSVAVRKAVLEAGPIHVCAISLSSQRETVLPLDSQLRPLHAALLWADTRGVRHVSQLVAAFGDNIQKWTGLIPNATYTAGKILWFRDEYPELMKQTKYFLQPKDYLLYRMSGVLATDRSLASRTMLYNVADLAWQPELMQSCGVSPDQFPNVYPADTIVAELRASVATEWGLRSGIPIILGGGDRACEVLGSGIALGELMESSGSTSNVACSITRLPMQLPPRVACSVHVVPGEWILEQGLSSTGTILDWWHTLGARMDRVQDLRHEIESSPPGANGLVVLPFFMGTRAPRWNPHAKGGILGLTLGHSYADISRAILEGIGYELRLAIEIFEQSGAGVTCIRLIGGGALLTSWNQIKADIYERTVVVPKVVHAASFGAFLLAAKQLQWISSYAQGQQLNPPVTAYEPNPQLTELYNRGYELYSQLYGHMEGVWGTFHAYRTAMQKGR